MERMASIELATKNEETEMEYYFQQGKRSMNPVVKAIFTNLAAEEHLHKKLIETLHNKLTKDGSWPQDVPIEIDGTNIKSVLDGLVSPGSSAAQVHYDDDDIVALQKAVEFEADAEKFYRELADACTNPQEEKFFRMLSGIEREHMLSIKDSLFYLEDPQGWFEEKERQNLDG
jgi:rubrerythrin